MLVISGDEQQSYRAKSWLLKGFPRRRVGTSWQLLPDVRRRLRRCALVLAPAALATTPTGLLPWAARHSNVMIASDAEHPLRGASRRQRCSATRF
jgi:hypothetical protein